VGGYDGTLTDIGELEGETMTQRSRTTFYLLEAEEGIAMYVPNLDCVLEGTYDGGALEFESQRCFVSSVDGTSGFDFRVRGSGEVAGGKLEVELDYSGTITIQTTPFQTTGTAEFKGDKL
jgi:hypothetical protein